MEDGLPAGREGGGRRRRRRDWYSWKSLSGEDKVLQNPHSWVPWPADDSW
jgi:hypothetical protein